jgi:hypothetical protein
MSITMSTTTIYSSDPLTWKQADTDVHVATRDGEFAGFVEFDGTAYPVRDARGSDLGTYATLDAAQTALESAHAPTPTRRGRGLPRALWRRPRRARV